MKKSVLPSLIACLALVTSSKASFSLYAEYHLGEAGSLGASNLPLDSSGNGKNLTSAISGTAATTGTSGVSAPGSTTYLDTSGTGNEGWYGSSLYSTAPALATDNFAFGAYASSASIAAANQGDVLTVGGGNSAFKLSLDSNGWAASSHNAAWIGTANGTSGSFTANTWVHLALIRSAGVTTFYVNGVAQPGTYSGTPVNDSPHMSVSPGGGSYFDGQIDEARVLTFTAGESTANILSVLQYGVLATPAFSLVGGTYLGPQNVAITTTTPGATIYYTTDGSTPTTSSSVYSTPIALTIPSTTTIQAFAVKSGFITTPIISATYTTIAGSTATWITPAGGSWSTGSNWQDAALGSGTDITADFSTLDLAADATVTLDGTRTLGNMVFADTTPDFNWTLNTGSGGPLTLAVSSGTPAVTVSNQTATIGAVLAGTQGLAKAGTGKLVLTGTNTYSGGTTVNAGTLQVGSGGTAGTLGAGNIVTNGLLDYNFGTSTTVSLPTGTAISGSGSVSALANIVRMNGNMTLGGSITLLENGNANAIYEGLELASTSTLTASAITLYGNLGKRSANGNDLVLDTSAVNGPISMQISTGLGNVWYIINSVTANAGTGTITIPGVGPGGPHAFSGAIPSWLAPTSLRGAVQVTGNVPAGAPVTIEATGTSLASGDFSGAMTLTKTGAATLTLAGANTYTGATTVNAGTLLVTGSTASASSISLNNTASLGGTGTIGGALTLASGTTLSPGISAIGTLTVNNSLTLNANSTVVMEISKDGGIATSDLVTGLTGTLTYAGTLDINDITGDSTPLAIGDKFHLFTKASGGYAGAFTTINLPALPPGTKWDTSGLTTDGSIQVQNALVALAPSFSLISGTYVGVQSVTMSAESGAVIHYTTNGSEPTVSSPVYGIPVSIPVNAVTTLKALAVRSGYADSSVTTATYTVWSTPVWLSAVTESWEIGSNWSNGFIPNAPGLPADFNTLDLTADTNVLIDNPITIGSMILGDTDPSHNWILDNLATAPLTLAVDSGSPVINVVNQTTTVLNTVAGTQGLVKTGSGTLAFNGANTYSGATSINQGTLLIRNSYTSSSYQIASGAALEFNVASGSADRAGTAITGAGTLRKTGAGQIWWYTGATNVSLSAGSLVDVQGGTLIAGDNGNDDWSANQSDLNVVTGAVFNGRDAEVHVNAITGGGVIQGGYPSFPNAKIICGVANGGGTFSGVIANASGACPFTKTGTGTQKLTGASTFTGATTIEAGTLIVNGSLAAGSAVTVAGGTLGGTGTINGTVAINNATTIAPGDGGTGTLHTGATTLAGTYACDVDGANSDLLAVTGNLNLTGSTLTVSGTSTAGSFVIATYTGTRTGSFAAAPSGYILDYNSTPNTIRLVKDGSYESWALTNNVTGGFTGDSDKDGISNLVEYALNLNPSASDGAPGVLSGDVITFTKRAAAITNADVSYVIETSATLEAVSWTPVVTQAAGNTDPTISYSLPTGLGKIFARLVVTKIP